MFQLDSNDYNSNNDVLKAPYIEIKVSSKSINGNDGCNNFRGNIGLVTENKISMQGMMGTRMMCVNMKLTNKFNEAITDIAFYEIANNKLQLKNAEGVTIMVFKKVD